jgi:hypothetical protein
LRNLDAVMVAIMVQSLLHDGGGIAAAMRRNRPETRGGTQG